jgi:type VI secretion system protein VasJ
MDLTVLGKTPVTEDQPAGSDVRYDPLFDALQAEIDKQSTPTASGGTDWKKVEKLAVEILSTKSKDILVASYLAVAQLRLRKEAGVAPSLHLYRDLLETFWENLFPPKKRKRGRVAAIEWWLEKAEPALQDLQPSPLPPEVIDTCRQDINRIGEVLRENLDAPVSLRVMERYIDSIPVASEAEPEPEKPSETAAPEAKPAQRSAPPPPADTGIGEMKSETDAEKTARAGFMAVRRAADFIENQNLADSRSYRWRRIAGWGMIQMLPPSTDGQTQVPTPTQFESAMNELNSLKAGQNWEALVRASEEKFQGTVLWLDLNRFAAEALTALGGNHLEAAGAVSLETALLVHRLPGIESLAFADGSPFAGNQGMAQSDPFPGIGGDHGTLTQPGGERCHVRNP